MTIRSANQSHADTQVQTLKGLMKLQLRVRQLSDQVQQIQKEQDYLRQLEDDFHRINHSTNLWIFLWPVLRSLYVVVYVVSFTSAW
ncbi:transmembrane emp24 domain-containing protein 9 isoform X2 [Austrofundulus limnaeus]|uniref:Transmembrane emp24 domain-containing protein 9-like isoform X1 n=1 Tax=Austrofundulus limnaeus TaxID=52670 RepID=A0A2I4DAH4_AUSLI|nr:PREDICTED: transmembrane emp24 domain-containing protein 9-like isoform X1 [Austrofundulus limnaeus]XP_013889238.1 PREDICTED: transmembrane emp24 domain-containing protein 9-like isoform X2 [Austrofundulus limnaeus]